MVERRQIVISRWATQAGRARAALEPGYVGIDERSFPELLAFAPSFARHVRYVAADNRPDGDWSDFFLADSAMVLASMAVFDATDRSRRFHEASRQVQSENSDALKLEHLKTLFDVILALPREVEAWHAAAETLRGDAAANALRALLASAIGRELAPLLAQLRSYGVGAGQPGALGHTIPVDCRHFQPIWQTEFVCPDGSIYRGHFRRQKINAALGPLTSLYEFLLGAASDLADLARRDFAHGLPNGRLKPHIALYVAFIKQYQVAQSRLNELPARVVDFYYREVLHEPLRPPVPDQIFLSFTRAPGITPAKVSRNTQFPAGADALGRPVLFLADQTLDVTRARLVRVRAMRITRGLLCDGVGRDAPASSTGHLHRVNLTNFLVGPDGDSPDGKPWAPFSAAVGSIGTMPQQAPLGFAIASPSLLLAGGQRHITVSLHYSEQTGAPVLDQLLGEIADATGLAADKALTQMLMEAFGFSVTTPTGWHEIVPGNVTVSLGEQIIAFRFNMPPSAPPLAAAAPALAGVPFDNVSAPVLRARLRQDPVTFIGSAGTVKVYPLSLLEGLRVEDIVIEIGVSGLPGVTVRTRGGAVDPTTPFLPFGAPARPGAWFEIQHRELFTKPLDRITVSIDWLGLPADPRGFAGHYEQYVVGPDRRPNFPSLGNDSFRAAPTLTGDVPWSLSGDSGPVYLFRTDQTRDVPEASGPLEVRTVLGFTAGPRADAALPASPGAALRITLMDPPFGFGDELYSPNVLYAIHFVQAPPVRRHGLLCRLLDFILGRPVPMAIPPDVSVLYPNPPWQPEIASLSIGYHSTTRLDLQGTQAHEFLHLLPTGTLAPAMSEQSRIPRLLPKVSEHAQLDLGFTDLGVAQKLTMLFRMTGEGDSNDDNGGVTWHAMGANGWIDLASDAGRVRDGSNGLRHSGIVSLDLPPMAADATAERLFWIRVVPRRDPDSFPAIVAITPHALTATRVVDSETGALSAIPPMTVKAAAVPLAGVATVDQPIASFGGQAGETPATLPIRLGERLRHKERASLAWDHERLVLERFPEIAKVRVLAARNAAGSPMPGELLVVVVPDPDCVSATDLSMPRMSIDARGRIEASLQAATSPFARIHVIDPAYVRVAVRADIVFREDASGDGPTQLNDDLSEFLSPWSDGLDLPDDAGAGEIRAALANFIATRSYVAGLTTLTLGFEPSLETLDWCVLTSAASHDIRVARPTSLNSGVRMAADEYVMT